MWKLHGVEVCEEKTIKLSSSSAKHVTWEGFGLKLHFHEQSLPEGTDQCLITIKASIAGQYQFPDNNHLVSAIFWLRCQPMCKFANEITVEIQHCAKSDDKSKLSFVRAVCSQDRLPYTFKKIGGDFTDRCSYGSIRLNRFSGVGITQQSEEREYYSRLFYVYRERDDSGCYEVHFVITWNIEAHITVSVH